MLPDRKLQIRYIITYFNTGLLVTVINLTITALCTLKGVGAYRYPTYALLMTLTIAKSIIIVYYIEHGGVPIWIPYSVVFMHYYDAAPTCNSDIIGLGYISDNC